MTKYLKLLFFIYFISASVSANPFENTNLSPGDISNWSQPYIYEKNEILVVDIKSTHEILRALVPEPLIPNTENIIKLYIANLSLVKPANFSYPEAGLVIPVTYNDKRDDNKNLEKFYVPILYLDQIGPIIGGREIYGFPKHEAEIEILRTPKFIHGIVKRHGEKIIDIRMDLENRIEQISGERHWDALAYKRIPSVNLKNEYAVRQITSTTITTTKIHEQFSGKVTLNFYSTLSDPLGEIKVLDVGVGIFQIDDYIMPEGKVLYDYLK